MKAEFTPGKGISVSQDGAEALLSRVVASGELSGVDTLVMAVMRPDGQVGFYMTGSYVQGAGIAVLLQSRVADAFWDPQRDEEEEDPRD